MVLGGWFVCVFSYPVSSRFIPPHLISSTHSLFVSSCDSVPVGASIITPSSFEDDESNGRRKKEGEEDGWVVGGCEGQELEEELSTSMKQLAK